MSPLPPEVRTRSGIARLHHTIATGEVISKTAAGGHALAVTDERWHPVVRAAMALRADREADLVEEAEVLVADALAVARWLMADAHRVGGMPR